MRVLKTCGKCGCPKMPSEFYASGGWCKECKIAYSRQHYAPIKAAVRRRRARVYDGSLKQCKTCDKWQPTTEYCPKSDNWDNLNHVCRTCQSEQGRRYREQHPERCSAMNRAWYERNREKHLANYNAWRKMNPEAARAIWHRRKAKLMEAGGDFSKEQWVLIKAHYAPGGFCPCCSEKLPLTIDHVIPIAQGGMNHIGNIQPLCQPCNSQKGSRRIDDFRPDGGEFAKALMQEVAA